MFVISSLLIGKWISCFRCQCGSASATEWVKRCWLLSVCKCTDELVNIPKCDMLCGRGSRFYCYVDQRTMTEARGWWWGLVVQNVLVCSFYSVNYYIFNNKCVWLCQPMLSPWGLIWLKVCLFNGTFSAVHTSSIVCLQVWVCLHTCVCLCLSCVRAGLQGHLRPWFPAQDEWALLYHCLGQQWSRLRLAMFGGAGVQGGWPGM